MRSCCLSTSRLRTPGLVLSLDCKQPIFVSLKNITLWSFRGHLRQVSQEARRGYPDAASTGKHIHIHLHLHATYTEVKVKVLFRKSTFFLGLFGLFLYPILYGGKSKSTFSEKSQSRTWPDPHVVMWGSWEKGDMNDCWRRNSTSTLQNWVKVSGVDEERPRRIIWMPFGPF